MNSLTSSFHACRDITRHHAQSFYFASHTLPKAKRLAAYAIYAPCRYFDDQIDSAENPETRSHILVHLHKLVEIAYTQQAPPPSLPWFLAFQETVQTYSIPQVYFLDLLTGLEMDRGRVRLEKWEELRQYCYHVASVVGLMMTPILTEQPQDDILPPAIDLGIAMQLTNILRDIPEDLSQDRIYLPRDEMARYGVGEEDLHSGRISESFRGLMRFQIGRAREYYSRAEKGIQALPSDGSRLTVWMMREIYAGILDEIERSDYQVLKKRMFVSLPRKCWLACRAWKQARTSFKSMASIPS